MIARINAVTPVVPEGQSRQVERMALGRHRLRHHRRDGNDADECDRHVHQEDRTKEEVCDEGATGDRTQRDCDARRRSPESERLGPFSTVLEDDRERRQCRREDERRARAH